MRNEFAIIVMV